MSTTPTITAEGGGDSAGHPADTRADRRMLIDGQLVDAARTFATVNPAMCGDEFISGVDPEIFDVEGPLAMQNAALILSCTWTANIFFAFQHCRRPT